ncbi:GspE/PulE family protein [Pseudohongiella nitratireducens]|uniref:GspE/PulE family protein n=1 Tax=Pseudohongiella nitratireducens TaxID=1768907 RepID=UPI0030EC71F4
MQALYQSLISQGWLSQPELAQFLDNAAIAPDHSLTALAEYFPERRPALNQCLSIALGIPWIAPELIALEQSKCELEISQNEQQAILRSPTGGVQLLTRPDQLNSSTKATDKLPLTLLTDEGTFQQSCCGNDEVTTDSSGLSAAQTNHSLSLSTLANGPTDKPDSSDISEPDNEHAPAVKLLNNIIAMAVRQKASDIHLEVFQHQSRIRFRVDGQLQQHDTVSSTIHKQLISRLKVLAQLDITERRQPQDGRLTIQQPGSGNINMRLSTLPTAWGEKAVIRIQSAAGAVLAMAHLGLSEKQLHQTRKAISRHQGLVLVTGPTGSGKTQTLYAMLNQLNQPSQNLMTLEDPIEIDLPGINQIAVSATSKMTFQHAIKSMLRQDPDIVMLGEIRDRETADTAIKAAQTGHLMLSTLHTNGCTESLIRLINLGIAPYNLSDTLTLIIAQRLLRKLCRHCKKPLPGDISSSGPATEPDQEEPKQKESRQDRSTHNCFTAVGCSACHNGYAGRIAIFEILPVTAELNQSLADNRPLSDLRQCCTRNIHSTLSQAAEKAWLQGLTTFQEIAPYLQESSDNVNQL